jgi:hypothetical protein
MFSTQTRRLDDAAFFSKVRDMIAHVLTQEMLDNLANRMIATAEEKIISKDLGKVVEVTAKQFGYNETTRNGILLHLAQGGDLSRYGLLNAITRQAQDEESYDMATQLETDGGRVIELSKTDWRQIAEAA